jgi:hypothetical protein
VPIREITEQAQVYLEQHPELFEQALERARKLGMIAPPMVTPDADHNAKSGTEKTQLFPTTSAIFSGSCLLIAY